MDKNIILFVCTGNTCRSVIAHALFQRWKDELSPGLDYKADSAGIAAFEGAPSTDEAILCMAKYGLDITNHRSKMVNQKLVQNSSYIFTMTHQQEDFLKQHFPSDRDKIFLLKSFCNPKISIYHRDIMDPVGKGLSDYEKTCRQLEGEIKRLIYRLREE